MSPVNTSAIAIPTIGMINNHPATIPSAELPVFIDGAPITVIDNPRKPKSVSLAPAETVYPTESMDEMSKYMLTTEIGKLIGDINIELNGRFSLASHGHHFTVRYSIPITSTVDNPNSTSTEFLVGRYGYVKDSIDAFKNSIIDLRKKLNELRKPVA